MANGLVIYRGPSALDGKPIVSVLTGFQRPSKNEKTGDMLQAWILRSDVNPVHALHHGMDESICGTCIHSRQKTCYVNVSKAPLSVWHAYRRGRHADIAQLAGTRHYTEDGALLLLGTLIATARTRAVRIGAYGDPAALPLPIIETMARAAERHTGYTHQWRAFPELRQFVVASADSLQDSIDAIRLGFRTFRTGADSSIAMDREITCPASEEAGKRTSCERCGLCNGATDNDRRANIRIIPHGASAVKFYRNSVVTAA